MVAAVKAHAFASEVLAPRRWLDEIIGLSPDTGDVLAQLEIANLSAAAACLSLVNALPPGQVLILMDGSNVEMALASSGTVVNLPSTGEKLVAAQLDRLADASGKARVSQRIVRWWDFPTAVEVGADDDAAGSSELISGILSTLPSKDAQQRASYRINGIIGAANGTYEFSSAEELHAVLRGRFASRGELATIIGHPDFDRYLARRAQELWDRRVSA